MQIAILVEQMRREGYEVSFCGSAYGRTAGNLLEPIETFLEIPGNMGRSWRTLAQAEICTWTITASGRLRR
jgi:predicted membrane GTPase involved in stress response